MARLLQGAQLDLADRFAPQDAFRQRQRDTVELVVRCLLVLIHWLPPVVQRNRIGLSERHVAWVIKPTAVWSDEVIYKVPGDAVVSNHSAAAVGSFALGVTNLEVAVRPEENAARAGELIAVCKIVQEGS
jgi:hypothetical protein